MPKNRIIPFGYCMINGEITAEPKEVYAVVEIFKEYLNGSSFLQIAGLMEREKISYSESSDKWNKNMVKRIIENEKYLGNDIYPQIISKDIFRQANEKRVKKAAVSNVDSNNFHEVRKRTYCAECGSILSRKVNGKGREYWNCTNPDCFKFEYRLTYQMIIGAVLTALNTVIANPGLLDTGGEISEYSPSADIFRQQNEINRMTDSSQVDFDKVKREIFRLAEMKYDCCTYNDSSQKTDEIREILKNHEQLNTLDIGLFKACVSRIWISHFCTITVELINGAKIKNIMETEKKNDHSAKCNDNSGQTADGRKSQ